MVCVRGKDQWPGSNCFHGMKRNNKSVFYLYMCQSRATFQGHVYWRFLALAITSHERIKLSRSIFLSPLRRKISFLNF